MALTFLSYFSFSSFFSFTGPDPNPKSDSDGLTAGGMFIRSLFHMKRSKVYCFSTAIAGIVTGIVIAAIAAVGAIAAAAGIIYKCWSGERKKKCETSSKQVCEWIFCWIYLC